MRPDLKCGYKRFAASQGFRDVRVSRGVCTFPFAAGGAGARSEASSAAPGLIAQSRDVESQAEPCQDLRLLDPEPWLGVAWPGPSLFIAYRNFSRTRRGGGRVIYQRSLLQQRAYVPNKGHHHQLTAASTVYRSVRPASPPRGRCGPLRRCTHVGCSPHYSVTAPETSLLINGYGAALISNLALVPSLGVVSLSAFGHLRAPLGPRGRSQCPAGPWRGGPAASLTALSEAAPAVPRRTLLS